MAAEQGVTDKLISISPRSLFAMIVGTVVAYIWVFSTFVTNDDMLQHTDNFQYHVDSSTIWQLETRAEDVSDKIDMIKERLETPAGNTSDNRKRLRELEKRKLLLEKQTACLRAGGAHCLGNVDPI